MKQAGIMVCITSLMLFACSGGTGGTGAGGTGGGTSDVSSGEVTKLGSVFVNGVEFNTTGAAITRDGATVPEASVLNMEVEVKGDITGSTGTATSVAASSTLKGVVDSVLNDTTMTVMGQTVRLADGAVVSTLSNADVLTDLVGGNYVEVHGLPKPGGVVVASYVEEISLPAEFKLKGYITGGTITATTFDIGGLTVNFSSADTTDLPGGPQPDQLVEVKAAGAPVAGVLTATRVEREGLSVTAAPEVEVEGYVKNLSGGHPNRVFFINGQEVHTSGTTTFAGITATYLAENVKVEAEGTLSGGILTANKVYLKDSIRMEGDIVGLSGNSFKLVGMPGINLTVIASTEYDSASSVLTDFSNGTHVRLRGYPDSASSVIVTRLVDRGAADSTVYLRGPVSAVADPNITIMSRVINLTGLSYSNYDESPIADLATFLSSVQIGIQVKVKGTQAAGVVTWDSAELED